MKAFISLTEDASVEKINNVITSTEGKTTDSYEIPNK
jgi:hypothetical protein